MSADSKSIDDLHPVLAAKCRAHIAACAAAGIPIRVTFTYRSLATQTALYAQGRTTVGPNPTRQKPLGGTVTNAKAGQSFHNFHLAYDAVPIVLVALDKWGDTPAHQATTDHIWALYGKLAKDLGMRWGGDFKSINDRPHCEIDLGFTLAQLAAGALSDAAGTSHKA